MAIPDTFTIESGMSAMPDTSFFTDSLNWLSIGTQGSIATILLALLSCLLITRNTKQIRIMLFPMLLAWNSVGLYPGMPALFISGIVFVHATLSTDVLAGLLTGTMDAFKSVNKKVTEPFREQKALQKAISTKIATKSALKEQFTPEMRADEKRRFELRYEQWKIPKEEKASIIKENFSTGAPTGDTTEYFYDEVLRRWRRMTK